MSDIEQLFSQLSPEHQREAMNFIEFLATKEVTRALPQIKYLSCQWFGDMSDLKEDMWALQQEALAKWGEEKPL